ncbi:hypothetical protein [Stieleria varia]|uniref:Uncharacterized protein n=1 Tax=Stieleria varia TaxID=2528005 RepID=A0A5C6B383_9BACT|nr:hypothetical protein [Stieleria varia]TWU05829.1 hypothetical protein Pla52n_15440 [Stieleria varia]
MSRITALGFVMLDTVLSIAMIVQSTLTLAVVLLTIAGSVGLAFLSKSLRSLLWPSYFWDDVQMARRPIKRG